MLVSPTRLALGAALVLALGLRIAAVCTFHVPGGDGVQYYRAAEELRRANRFAYAPPPAPLSYSRLPGYPLLTAYVIAPRPLPIESHVERATAVNLVFDLCTALLVLLILRERGFGRPAQWGGLLATILYPSLLLVSCFAMTESFSTLLATLELFLILRATGERAIRWAALAGVAAGAAQLVRADALTVAPALGVLLVLSTQPLRRRAAALGAFALAALVVFAPWPLRNLSKFGAPHFAACAWRTMDGTPLGTGPVEWARTWSSSAPGEAWFDLMFANNADMQLARPGVILPAMYSDEAEHQQVVALMDRYNHERLSPAVDEEFRKLAAQRRAAHPYQVFVSLPLQRVLRMWQPAPPWELPLRVWWLRQSDKRPWFGRIDKLLFALALAGAVVLWRGGRRSRERTTLAVLASCLLARSVLYSFAVPHGTTGRYLIEAVPVLIVLATVGATALLARARSMIRRPASTPPTATTT